MATEPDDSPDFLETLLQNKLDRVEEVIDGRLTEQHVQDRLKQLKQAAAAARADEYQTAGEPEDAVTVEGWDDTAWQVAGRIVAAAHHERAKILADATTEAEELIRTAQLERAEAARLVADARRDRAEASHVLDSAFRKAATLTQPRRRMTERANGCLDELFIAAIDNRRLTTDGHWNCHRPASLPFAWHLLTFVMLTTSQAAKGNDHTPWLQFKHTGPIDNAAWRDISSLWFDNLCPDLLATRPLAVRTTHRAGPRDSGTDGWLLLDNGAQSIFQAKNWAYTELPVTGPRTTMFGDLQQRNVLVTDTPTIQRYLKAVDTDVLSVKTKVAQVRSTANSNNRAENSTDLGEFEFLVTAPTA